ncbi:MAG: hypothetical protein JWN46_3054 [Acidimicrobiales bacterium]|nr:hypothetical protein [Acidimicrobiales bacterium]
MDVAAVLLELFDRVPSLARDAVDGLSVEQLVARPGPRANPIAWLIWHTARVQDHHGAELLDDEQLWHRGGWAPRFGLAPDADDTGYGHSRDEVASIQPESPETLLEYLDAVHARTRTLVSGLVPAELDRIVDRRWDPPVTLGVRLVSIADDSLQHMGQAAYARGLLNPDG